MYRGLDKCTGAVTGFNAGDCATAVADTITTATAAAKLVTTVRGIRAAQAGVRVTDDLLPGLPSSAPRPLGFGSTGRTRPASLTEQLAMTEVRAAPSGRVLPFTMTDARWPASAGWVKVSQRVNGVEIHYVRNTATGAVDDFKFIGRSAR